MNDCAMQQQQQHHQQHHSVDTMSAARSRSSSAASGDFSFVMVPPKPSTESLTINDGDNNNTRLLPNSSMRVPQTIRRNNNMDTDSEVSSTADWSDCSYSLAQKQSSSMNDSVVSMAASSFSEYSMLKDLEKTNLSDSDCDENDSGDENSGAMVVDHLPDDAKDGASSNNSDQKDSTILDATKGAMGPEGEYVEFPKYDGLRRPQKPTTAFAQFCQRTRESVQMSLEDPLQRKSKALVDGILRENFQALSEEEIQVYQGWVAWDRLRHARDLQIYEKTPRKPERPPSASTLFYKHERNRMLAIDASNTAEQKAIKKKNFDRNWCLFSRTIHAKWDSLGSNEKKMFEDKAREEKARYLAELAHWKEFQKKWNEYQKNGVFENSTSQRGTKRKSSDFQGISIGELKELEKQTLIALVQENKDDAMKKRILLKLEEKYPGEFVDELNSLTDSSLACENESSNHNDRSMASKSIIGDEEFKSMIRRIKRHESIELLGIQINPYTGEIVDDFKRSTKPLPSLKQCTSKSNNPIVGGGGWHYTYQRTEVLTERLYEYLKEAFNFVIAMSPGNEACYMKILPPRDLQQLVARFCKVATCGIDEIPKIGIGYKCTESTSAAWDGIRWEGFCLGRKHSFSRITNRGRVRISGVSVAVDFEAAMADYRLKESAGIAQLERLEPIEESYDMGRAFWQSYNHLRSTITNPDAVNHQRNNAEEEDHNDFYWIVATVEVLDPWGGTYPHIPTRYVPVRGSTNSSPNVSKLVRLFENRKNVLPLVCFERLPNSDVVSQLHEGLQSVLEKFFAEKPGTG